MDSSHSFPTHLSYSGDFLEKLVMEIPHISHVKEIKNKKYVLSNQKNADFYGLTDSIPLLDYSVYDLYRLRFITKTHLETIEALDYRAQKEGCTTHTQHIVARKDYLLRVSNLSKIPVIQAEKTVAIFTFSQEVTSKIEMIDLFRLYKKFYTKQQAIRHFLRYLKIENRFKVTLTETELLVLINAYYANKSKEIAERMKCNYRTIESHTYKIKEKLKGISFCKLLQLIRQAHVNAKCQYL